MTPCRGPSSHAPTTTSASWRALRSPAWPDARICPGPVLSDADLCSSRTHLCATKRLAFPAGHPRRGTPVPRQGWAFPFTPEGEPP
jgi:hypothetical protein